MAATASVSAIRAGQAFVELFVRDTSFTKGLDIAKRQFMAWGKAFVGVGAGISAAGAGVLGLLGGAVNSAAQYGKKLSDASARTGVAADTLSALGFAAEQSGANFEEMEVAIRRFQNNIADGTATKALNELHVAASDLQGKTFAEQLEVIAAAMDNVTDAAQRTHIATQLFSRAGRGGQFLIPGLTGGSRGFKALVGEAKESGIAMTVEDAAAAKAFADEMLEVNAVLKATQRQIGSALIPVLKEYLDVVLGASKGVLKFVRDHREIAVTVALVAAGVVAFGGVLVGVGFAAIGTSAAITVLQGALYLLGVAIGVVKAIAYGEILIPLGVLALLALAAAGAVTYFFARTEEGQAVLREMGRGLVAFGGRMAMVFGGVTDALASGDWGAAAKIGWMEVEREWTAFIMLLEDGWTFWENFFADGFDSMAHVAGHALEDLGASMRRTFIDLIAGIKVMWGDLWTWFRKQAIIAGGEVEAKLKNPFGAGPQIARNKATQEAAAVVAQNEKDKKDVLDQAVADKAKANADRDDAQRAMDKEHDKGRERRQELLDMQLGQEQELLMAKDADIQLLREELRKNRKQQIDAALGGGAGGGGMLAESTHGTFGAGTISGELGRGAKGAEKIAEAVEKGNEKLDKIADAVVKIEKQGGPQFA